MSLPKDERIQEIVTGEYKDSEGRMVGEIYETYDDGYFLISDRVLNKLIYEGTFSEYVSLEDAEAMYGEEIVQRYFERQEQERKERRMENLSRGIEIHKRVAEIRRAQIVAMVINGYSKPEIEEYYNVSRSTVDKVLRELTVSSVFNMYTHQGDIFENVSGQSVKAFVEVNCNYKAYRRYLGRLAQECCERLRGTSSF